MRLNYSSNYLMKCGVSSTSLDSITFLGDFFNETSVLSVIQRRVRRFEGFHHMISPSIEKTYCSIVGAAPSDADYWQL